MTKTEVLHALSAKRADAHEGMQSAETDDARSYLVGKARALSEAIDLVQRINP